MLELKVKVKKWGNSIGVLLPKKIGLRPNEELFIHVERMHEFTKVSDLFGKLKFRKPTAQLLKEVDRDLDPQ